MTTRLPPEELLQVIRISQQERRSEANPRREVEPERPAAFRMPAVPIVRGLRRPASEPAGRWSPMVRA